MVKVGAVMWRRWMLIFLGSFALGQVAFAVAGWKGMWIFCVSLTLGLVIGNLGGHP